MKCFVLAGGSSDRLWPLSRKEYPKQFMEIREGRSMFQEAILRNIPFCDEFIIITNKIYENVARGQMQAFQGIDYDFVFEEVSLKTAPALILCALRCDPDDELLIVSADCFIEGDYNTSLTQLKEIVKSGKIAAVTCKPTKIVEGYNYIYRDGSNVIFEEKRRKGGVWDCGILGAKVSVFLNDIDETLLENCRTLELIQNTVHSNQDEDIPAVSLGKALRGRNCELVSASFSWTRITDISSFYNFYDKAIKNNSNAICNNGKGVEIVNLVDDQLIIVNGLKNVVVVNTRDVIYVTNSTKEADIKGIADKYYSSKKQYFDIQPKKYESWGMEELIGSASDCTVKLLTVYPHESFEVKPKRNMIVNMISTNGKVHWEGASAEGDFEQNQNFTISDGISYRFTNTEKTNLEIVYTQKPEQLSQSKPKKIEYLVKMQPAFKDNLWGGTKIRDVYGKNVGDMDIIAESWELSAHPDGQSKVAFGNFAGKTLSEYISLIGKDKLGWKAQTYDRFPLMVKFIDARQNLSIQVHPADEYALSIEGEYGKNEMWHILDADEDACIYVGFNRNVTTEEVRRRIADNTLMQVLNKVPVKKDETYFLKAGTVHAIGAGCLICEIQQSSNVTYRLYDYGRKDKNGNFRELHINKALDVLNLKAYLPKTYEKYEAIMHSDYVKMLIGQCKYFTVNKYYVEGECMMPLTESSFQVFVVLNGKGTISDGDNVYETNFGDTWFCASGVQITLNGKFSVLAINI